MAKGLVFGNRWNSLKMRLKAAMLVFRMPVVYDEDLETMNNLCQMLDRIRVAANKEGTFEKGCYKEKGDKYFN